MITCLSRQAGQNARPYVKSGIARRFQQRTASCRASRHPTAATSAAPACGRKFSDFNSLYALLTLEARARDSYTLPPSVNGVSGRPMRPSLPPDYHPSDDEEFMNPLQVEYFRQKLLNWRAQLLAESSDTMQHLKEESLLKPDLADRASLEVERAIELRTRARERKLISKINAALNRLDDGTYGYCEETEEPIGIRRLEARPIATLSIEAQERHERMERTHRDD
jgi:DnaK suppressor protein